MIQMIFIVAVFIGLAFIGLAFNIIFRKQGKFPAYSVGSNAEMKKRGLSCVKCEEMKLHRKRMKARAINPKNLKIIS